MSKKRINPEVDRAIGRAQLPRVSSPRKYSIVGDGGTPVGPDPLSQLSQALTGFNRNLQSFAGANNVAGQKKAMEMLPELEQYVTDTAIELKKAFDKHGINPRFNPAVASTATLSALESGVGGAALAQLQGEYLQREAELLYQTEQQQDSASYQIDRDLERMRLSSKARMASNYRPINQPSAGAAALQFGGEALKAYGTYKA